MRDPNRTHRLILMGALLIYLAAPTAAHVNINTETVKKAIVFIYRASPNGDAIKSEPDATGFIVAVPNLRSPLQYWLLVTARHVVDKQWANCGAPNPNDIFLRVNTSKFDPSQNATGVAYVKIPLREAGRRLFAVSDDESDVAVMKLNPVVFDRKKYAVDAVDLSDFGTREELRKLSIGDDLMTAGLLRRFTGVRRNYPVFKFGKISEIPGETLPVPCDDLNKPPRQIRAWLIAANSVSGSSGAPIFYVQFEGNSITSAGRRVFLAGLQSTTFRGADVAGMTPADAIFDTIQAMNLPDANLYRGPHEEPVP